MVFVVVQEIFLGLEPLGGAEIVAMEDGHCQAGMDTGKLATVQEAGFIDA